MRHIRKQRNRLLAGALIFFVWISLDIAAQTGNNGGGDGDGSSGAEGKEYVKLFVDAHQCSSEDWASFVLSDGQAWDPKFTGDNCAQGAAGTGTFQLKRGEKYTLKAIPRRALYPADGGVSLGWRIRADEPSVSITGTAPTSVWQNPMREEEYQVVVPKVEILHADVTEDEIQLRLEPPGLTGTLTLELVEPDNHVIRSEERAGSTDIIRETFNINNLAVGEYHKVKATWNVNGAIVRDEFDYHIKVLGMYNHTRYNTPTETLCAGAETAYSYTEGDCPSVQECSWTEGTGVSEWLTEVVQNGSGYSSSGEYFSLEWFCTNPAATYRLRRVPAPCPRCGGILTANSSVAVQPEHPDLPCGAEVYVDTIGMVTVQDTGGGVQREQLDHYAGTSGCNREGGSIGQRMTIRIF